MAWPQDPMALKVHLKLDGSTWTDVSSSVLYESRIQIRAGSTGVGNRVDSSSCTFQFRDDNGDFAPDNPEGAYYPEFGLNTPVRVSVEEGEVALVISSRDSASAFAPDVSQLDVTGDLDVAIEGELWGWSFGSNVEVDVVELIGKWGVAPNRSWFLAVREGYPSLRWSTTGSDSFELTGTEKLRLPGSTPRFALRFTMDVNNGSGGHTVTFYRGTSIAAADWEVIGEPVVGSGTTSIASAGASLKIGDCSSFVFSNPVGRYLAAEMRNGIGGTVVANPDFTAQASGTTSFQDGAGNTWSLSGNEIEISSRKILFTGEIASLTPRTSQKNFRYVEVEAGGPMRHHEATDIAFRSAMYRTMTAESRSDLAAYWPLEDGSEATVFASGLPGGRSLARTDAGISMASYSTWGASSPMPTFDTGTAAGYLGPVAATGYIELSTFLAVPSTGVAGNRQLVEVRCSGTAPSWKVWLDSSGDLDVRAYNEEGSQILAHGFTAFAVEGKQRILRLTLQQDGSDVDYDLTTLTLEDGSLLSGIPSVGVSGTLASRTIGSPTGITLGTTADLEGTAFGQVSISTGTGGNLNITSAIMNYAQEHTSDRMGRIQVEEGIDIIQCGFDSTRLGGQGETDMLTLLRDSAKASGGILAECKDFFGLLYRSPDSLEDQEPVLELTYVPGGAGAVVEPFSPNTDDTKVVNDFTATRTLGTSVRLEQTEGRKSVNQHPDGVGRYQGSDDFNLAYDNLLRSICQWQLALGTTEAPRFPKLTILVQKTPGLLDAVARAYVGDIIAVSDMPVRYGGGVHEFIINGYTMDVDQYEWRVQYDLSPGAPYRTAIRDSAVHRRDTAGTEISEGVDATDTEIPMWTSLGPKWIDTTNSPGDFPLSLGVGGEEVEASAITSSAKDSFTRSVSNGWGTSEIGGAWTNVNGAASEYAVTGSKGRHAVNALNSSRYTHLPARGADTDQVVTCRTPALAAGGSQFFGLLARYQSLNDFYTARVEFTTAAGVNVQILKGVGGTLTSVAGPVSTGLTHVANTDFKLRFRVVGSDLLAKVWLASQAEPSNWNIVTTDTSHTVPGSTGCRSTLMTGNTNTLPFNIDYDDYEVGNPQLATVTRSQNGVVKAHSEGTPISLARPSRRGL